MDTLETDEFELAVRQTRELIGVFRDAVGRYAVSENEFWIWYSLIVLGGKRTQQEICATWSLHKQTVNNIVAGMVKKGYATLEAVPGNRNQKDICLTDLGRTYGEQLIHPVFEAEKRAFSRLPGQEREVFRRVLERYVTILRQEMREIG